MVTNLAYQGYPSQQISNPQIVSAESMITDGNLYKKNGKPRSLRAQYKDKTLIVIDNLITDLNKFMSKEIIQEQNDW